MNLAAQRPDTWNSVVGQEKAITVLQALLRNQTFLTRGLLFYGALGVGKTTTAYLMAKALMCTGTDPLGCGTCDSCLKIAAEGIDAHPDFIEIDGGQKSGVDAAREMTEWASVLPIIGRRRVGVIDEASFLSPEAWAAYLKWMEQGDLSTVIIFVSNEVEKIKRTTTSRCAKVPFERVSVSTMVGLLSKVATDNHIVYERSALDIIARQSNGIIRDAVQWLNAAAALGEVKENIVKLVIDTSVEDRCAKLLLAIAKKDQINACRMADEIVLNAHPQQVLETMISLYARAIWQKDAALQPIYLGLPNVGAVTAVLVKWANVSAPADILPIVVFELLQTQQVGRATMINAPLTRPLGVPPPAAPKPKSALAAFLNGEVI